MKASSSVKPNGWERTLDTGDGERPAWARHPRGGSRNRRSCCLGELIGRVSHIAWAAALVFLAGTFSAPADNLRIDGIAILERGVFRGRSGTKSIAESHFGSVVKVRDVELVQSTTTIRARRSLRFGLRYVIRGAPAGTSVDMRFVTRFPRTGLLDPATGVRHYESAYVARDVIGVPSYREFMFDHAWEIVAGEWFLEFWRGGRLVASQRFCVLADESSAHPSETHCEFLMGRPSSWPYSGGAS